MAKKGAPGSGDQGKLKRDDLSAEDRALWRLVTKDAKPMTGRKAAKPAAGESPQKTEPATGRARPIGPKPAPVADKAKAIDPGARADVDRRTADRLRRGKLPIERRLDLHGFREVAAERHLAEFLASASRDGLRCVLVITGKGPGREGGVLRQKLPQWLNQPINRSRVIAFASAQPQHGGHGAVYVLLRRRRAD